MAPLPLEIGPSSTAAVPVPPSALPASILTTTVVAAVTDPPAAKLKSSPALSVTSAPVDWTAALTVRSFVLALSLVASCTAPGADTSSSTVIAPVAVIVTAPLAPVSCTPVKLALAPPIVSVPVLSTNTPPVPVEASRLVTWVSRAPAPPVPMPVLAASAAAAAVRFTAPPLASLIAPAVVSKVTVAAPASRVPTGKLSNMSRMKI